MRDHGGNIHEQSRKKHLPVSRIVDFSASINPLGMPRAAVNALKKQIAVLPHYPEPYSESLSLAIAKHNRVSPASVLCGNGSMELIYLIPNVLKPKRVLTTAPAFSEYEKACEGAEVSHYTLRREEDFDFDVERFIEHLQRWKDSGKYRPQSSDKVKHDLVFLGNPNNPTGRVIKRRDILKIAGAAGELKCYLVVDEAFIDFCPEHSVITSVRRNPYLIVLRSMTKFYALAGLRVGYGIFPLEIAERMKRWKEPWSVNTLAAAAGSVVLSDKTFRDASLAIAAREKRFLEESLSNLRIKYFPSDVNYYLLRMKNAGEIVRSLGKKNILIRDCSNFHGLGPGFIRIAVRSRKENILLIRELKKLCRAS